MWDQSAEVVAGDPWEGAAKEKGFQGQIDDQIEWLEQELGQKESDPVIKVFYEGEHKWEETTGMIWISKVQGNESKRIKSRND